MTKVYCTICSKDKRTDEGLLPAKERYISDRIKKVGALSENDKVPFFILSGEFGLLKSDKQIPYYDHLLISEEVATLTERATKQLSELKIDEVVFFAKPKKKNWIPYYDVLECATNALGIRLNVRVIDY